MFETTPPILGGLGIKRPPPHLYLGSQVTGLRYGSDASHANVLAVRTDARWGSGHWCADAKPMSACPSSLPLSVLRPQLRRARVGALVHARAYFPRDRQARLSPLVVLGGAPSVRAACSLASCCARAAVRYEGGGIKRAVHLERLPPTHFVTDGVFASPQHDAHTGRITVLAELQWLRAGTPPAASLGSTPPAAAQPAKPLRVRFTLRERGGGAVIASNVSSAVRLAEGSAAAVVVRATLQPPPGAVDSWSVFSFADNKTLHPTAGLYTLTAAIVTACHEAGTEGGRHEAGPEAGRHEAGTEGGGYEAGTEGGGDQLNVTCGFRSAAWRGKFWLNGAPTQLRGFSHHDNFAAVGVAMPPRVHLFQAQLSRALGANFWRMSHNPYDDAVYSILDALGVLVWG